MIKNIAIIDPCFFGIGFVESAYKRGFILYAVVPHLDRPRENGYESKIKGALVADTTNPEEVLKALKTSPIVFDAIIPGHEFVISCASFAARALGLPHQPEETVQFIRRKDLARLAYEKKGVPNPKFAVASTFGEAKLKSTSVGFPFILKPVDGAGSQKIFKINNEKELENAFLDFKTYTKSFLGFSVRGQYLLEEYIEGPEFSVEIVVSKGQTLFAQVTEKTNGAPHHFVELAHILPATQSKDVTNPLIETAEAALSALNYKDGVAHVELKISSRGPIIIESNLRPAGDHITEILIPLANELNLFDSHICAFLGETVTITRPKKNAAVITYLTTNKEGILDEIIAPLPGFVATKKKGDLIGPPKDSTDRLGHFICQGADPVKLKQQGEEFIRSLSVKIIS